MAQLLSAGAVLQCTMGSAPSTLNVLPAHRVLARAPLANIMDHVPLANILPFGTCQSLANPVVAAATAAALGVLTPMPCVPVMVAPWVPGVPKVLVGDAPAVDSTCQLVCAWGGAIAATVPGQFVATAG
jgi:hypothetical protein